MNSIIATPPYSGGVPKRSTGADCKSVGLAFVGSNPTPSIVVVGAKLAGEMCSRLCWCAVARGSVRAVRV